MSDQTEQESGESGPSWISLAAACRVTMRPDITIKGWKTAGAFTADEWRYDESRRQGVGHPVLIRIDALERVHRDRGGVYWRPELALAVNPTPGVKKQLEALEDELRAREVRIKDLERRLADATERRVHYTPVSADVADDEGVGAAPIVRRYAASLAPPAPQRRAQSSMLSLPSLPDDWIAFNTEFCDAHGRLDGRSIARDPDFPIPHERDEPDGRWLGHGVHPQPVKKAYDLQQHIVASRLAHDRWPAKFKPCDTCQPYLAGSHLASRAIVE